MDFFFSPFEMNYLWLPLIGLAVGLLASMIGGGGGFVFPPVLILLFGIPAQIAVPTSLAATLPICMAGAGVHYRNGTMDVRAVTVFGLAGILGALGGALLTGMLTTEQLKSGFGLYAILLAGLMLLGKDEPLKPASDGGRLRRAVRRIPRGTFYGFAGGFIAGTFGTSGTAPVLAGLFASGTPLRLIAGTSLLIVFINTLSALAGHVVLGVIDLSLVLMLTAGSVLGGLTGPRITRGIKLERREGGIKRVYALVMLAFGIFMLVF